MRRCTTLSKVVLTTSASIEIIDHGSERNSMLLLAERALDHRSYDRDAERL